MEKLLNIIKEATVLIFVLSGSLFVGLVTMFGASYLLRDNCEAFQLGHVTTYECPAWHPDNYALLFILATTVSLPLLAHYIYDKKTKKKLFSLRNYFIILVIIAFIYWAYITFLYETPDFRYPT